MSNILSWLPTWETASWNGFLVFIGAVGHFFYNAWSTVKTDAKKVETIFTPVSTTTVSSSTVV